MLGRLDRQARDAFLLSGCHLGLLSAAEAAAELCLGGDRPALRRELAAGLGGAEPAAPALAKAAEVRPPGPFPEAPGPFPAAPGPFPAAPGPFPAAPGPPAAPGAPQGQTRRKKKPWDDWPPDDDMLGAPGGPGSATDAAPPAGAAARLLASLLADGRYEEALLSGCRLAAGGGRGAAWAEAVAHARLVFGPGGRGAAYVERLADVESSAPWRGARSSPAFESALAAALAVCSGALPVRRGWRRSRERRDRYEEALNTVSRRSEAERVRDPPAAAPEPRGGRACHVTVVVAPRAARGSPRGSPRGPARLVALGPRPGLEDPRPRRPPLAPGGPPLAPGGPPQARGGAPPGFHGRVSLLRRAEEPEGPEGQLPGRRQARGGPEEGRQAPRPAQRPHPRRVPLGQVRPG